jgi:hypothetical protein
MGALFRAFLAISLLRSGPQELPASSVLLALSIVVYALVGVLLSLISLPWGSAVLASLLDTLLLVAFGYTVLNLRGLAARLTQTLTALAGSLALLGIVSLPLTAWLYQAESTVGDAGVASFLLLVILLWNILLIAHILRHAVNISFPLGLVVSVAYLSFSLAVLDKLFATAA